MTAVGNLLIAVPFVPASRRAAEEMVRFAGLKGDENIYDLGAGDGRILIAAKRLHPRVRATGIEYVPSVWLMGKLRIWFSRLRITFLRGDAMKLSVADAQCIFLYLFPPIMVKLEEKFDRELKPGTKVVSLVFSFPHRTPVAQKQIPWFGKTGIVRLYQW